MRTALVVIAASTLFSSSARAEVLTHRRVVLVAMPEVVFGATTAALGPWSIAVDAAEGPVPVDDAAAAEIARAHDASAVAWLDGGDLVIYDDLRGTSERRAAQPPTDDVTAAAIALSLKTALRRPVERIDPPPPPPPPPPPSPPPTTDRQLFGAVHLGLGVPTATTAEAMLHLDVRGSYGRHVAVIGALGGGIARVDEPAVEGSYREVVVGLGVALRQPWGSLVVTPSALGTLHIGQLRTDLEDDRAISPAFELALAVDRQVGPIRLGGQVTGEVLARPTRYQVQGMDVLTIPRVGLGFALRIAF